MHELGFDEDMADRDEVERRLLARLMPEGYEWPRFEDGEPVRIGDEFAERIYGNPCKVGHFAINKYAFLIFDEEDVNDCEAINHGTHKRVKRPAKVLDADGVEIRVGDTVYLLPGDWCGKFPLLRCHEWDAMKVLNLRPNHETGRIECGTSATSVVCCPYPSQLTHRAPVVRCRDCRRSFEERGDLWCRGIVGPPIEPDGFCAWGEEREA